MYASNQQGFPIKIGSGSEPYNFHLKCWMCGYDFNCSTTHKDELPNKVGMNVRFSNIRGRDDWQLKIMCEVNYELSRSSLNKYVNLKFKG